MTIYCCECKKDVVARLTNGREIYPHRSDLYSHPFWKCDSCFNYVGCHHKTKSKTRPLGCIPNGELRSARQKIHALLDPIWKNGKAYRSAIYAALAKELGLKEYHTAEIKSVEEAAKVCEFLKVHYSGEIDESNTLKKRSDTHD